MILKLSGVELRILLASGCQALHSGLCQNTLTREGVIEHVSRMAELAAHLPQEPVQAQEESESPTADEFDPKVVH